MSTELTLEEWKKLAEHYHRLLDDKTQECVAAWALVEKLERGMAELKRPLNGVEVIDVRGN